MGKPFIIVFFVILAITTICAQDKKQDNIVKPKTRTTLISYTLTAKDSVLIQEATKNAQLQKDSSLEYSAPYIDHIKGRIAIPEFTDLIDVGNKIK